MYMAIYLVNEKSVVDATRASTLTLRDKSSKQPAGPQVRPPEVRADQQDNKAKMKFQTAFLQSFGVSRKKSIFAQLNGDAKIGGTSGNFELRLDNMEQKADYEFRLTPLA